MAKLLFTSLRPVFHPVYLDLPSSSGLRIRYTIHHLLHASNLLSKVPFQEEHAGVKVMTYNSEDPGSILCCTTNVLCEFSLSRPHFPIYTRYMIAPSLGIMRHYGDGGLDK